MGKNTINTSINRRKFLAGSTAVGIASVSGCMSLSYEAIPARVNQQQINQSQYEMKQAKKISAEKVASKFSNEDISNRFTATSYFVTYSQDDLPQTISVLSTPSIGPLGIELNPLSQLETKTILELVIGQLRDQDSDLSIETIRELEKKPIDTTLGERTLEVFELEMESSDFGDVTLEFYVIKHRTEESILFTGSIVVKEVRGLPTGYDGFEPQKEQALSLLTDITYPADWESIKSNIDSSGSDDSSDGTSSDSTDTESTRTPAESESTSTSTNSATQTESVQTDDSSSGGAGETLLPSG